MKVLGGITLLLIVLALALPACKSCNKKDTTAAAVDSTSKSPDYKPSNTLNLPHADSTLIPVLSKILDQAFDAAAKKDNAKLAGLIVYKGADSTRFGYDVFSLKHPDEKAVIRITMDVFNKWNRGVESRDYGRVFDLDQPDGRKMTVLEVIFVSKKTLDRKFFGFLKLKDDYKIVDVTNNL